VDAIGDLSDRQLVRVKELQNSPLKLKGFRLCEKAPQVLKRAAWLGARAVKKSDARLENR
jgi:hypothetical protein